MVVSQCAHSPQRVVVFPFVYEFSFTSLPLDVFHQGEKNYLWKEKGENLCDCSYHWRSTQEKKVRLVYLATASASPTVKLGKEGPPLSTPASVTKAIAYLLCRLQVKEALKKKGKFVFGS